MQDGAGKTGSAQQPPTAKEGAQKVGSRAGSKSPDGKKAAAGKAGAEEPAMKKTDSKKNLVPRTKAKKQGEGARNNREAQEADEKGKNQGGGDEARSPEKAKKKKPGMAAARTGGGTLSQDFSSFDILWFDIETKMRDLIQDLCQPLVDKVHEGKDNLSQLRKQVEAQAVELQTLNQTVFEKGAKLDVFEEIHQRITVVEADRKRIESKLISDADVILRTFENYTFEKE